MNYYIQGDADNADKISAAFEKLGYDTSMHLFNAKSVLYFTFDGDIRATTNGLFITFIKSRSDYQELKLPKPHYDIANFHAGMPVLVRADNNCRWDYSVFSRITGNKDWPFAVCNGVSFTQCIPFKSNKHLLGTTNMCDKRFINW